MFDRVREYFRPKTLEERRQIVKQYVRKRQEYSNSAPTKYWTTSFMYFNWPDVTESFRKEMVHEFRRLEGLEE